MKRYIKFNSRFYKNPYYNQDWAVQNHKIYFDGEYHTFNAYFRNYGNYRIYIFPKYIEKSDMIVWEVSYFPLTGNLDFPQTTESFETFYDAMDFVDSGELSDVYGLNI